jgi:DNA polymerase I-like protein with 3'-5' exonuclease and polymerase domains
MNVNLDEYKKSWARKNKVKLADFNYGMLPSDILAPYACKDADATFQLYGKFKPLVEKSEEFTRLYNTILMPATHAMKTLEKNGGPINVEQGRLALLNNIRLMLKNVLEEINNHEAVQRFERVYEKHSIQTLQHSLETLFFNII